MKKCTDKEWKHCQEEKRTCKGCNFNDNEKEIKEAKTEELEFINNIRKGKENV